VRLVLDEQIDPAIAAELRRRGHDVVAVKEDPALIGMADPDLVAWALGAGRAIVTYNVRHFVPLVSERQAAGELSPGLVLLSPKRYPPGQRSRGAVIRDLARLLEGQATRDALSGRTIWLASD